MFPTINDDMTFTVDLPLVGILSFGELLQIRSIPNIINPRCGGTNPPFG